MDLELSKFLCTFLIKGDSDFLFLIVVKVACVTGAFALRDKGSFHLKQTKKTTTTLLMPYTTHSCQMYFILLSWICKTNIRKLTWMKWTQMQSLINCLCFVSNIYQVFILWIVGVLGLTADQPNQQKLKGYKEASFVHQLMLEVHVYSYSLIYQFAWLRDNRMEKLQCNIIWAEEAQTAAISPSSGRWQSNQWWQTTCGPWYHWLRFWGYRSAWSSPPVADFSAGL